MLQIEKELKIRIRALPVLEAKETALRLEIKKLSRTIENFQQHLKELLDSHASMKRLWPEMPELIHIDNVVMTRRLVAGIQVPV